MNKKPKIDEETTDTQSGLSVLDYLKKVPLFSNLSEKEIAYFEKAAQIRSYKKGKIIYVQGEPAQFFYVINGGWVKLMRVMPEGEEVIIDMLTTGHTFGETAIFEKNCYMCTAQVVEDVELLSVPVKVLKEQIPANPKLTNNMLTVMSRHHRHHALSMAFNTMLSAPQRIGCFLLRLCPTDTETTVKFRLPYDKTLIADTLGMKGSTFSRAINILRQKTHIRIDGDYVEVDSVQKLGRFVYGQLWTQNLSNDI